MKAIVLPIISLLLSGFISVTNAQNGQKAPVRIYLEHFKSPAEYQLSVRVLTKTDKRYRPTAGVEVALYSSEITQENLLGTIVTTENGTGIYTFTQKQKELAENLKTATYYAVINEDERHKAKETDITIKQVNLDVRYVIEDSVKQIQVHVSETDSLGNEVPQKNVQIKFLVKRPLSPLPVGDDYNTTDKKGNVAIEFPDDLPGDTDGFLKIMVRIVENEDYGTVEVSEVRQWGIPTFYHDDTTKRSLWASSANAPVSLLIFINSLIVIVWGMIFYMIYKIFRIRKIGM